MPPPCWTDTVLDAELHERHAVLRVAVVVVVQRDAALLRRLGDRGVDRVRLERREEVHGPRPAGRAPFDALVHRPHVLPRPAVGTELSPPVEVRRAPRTQIIALRELDPPRTRPRGHASRRPWRAPAARSRRPSRPRRARAREAAQGRGSRGSRRDRRPRAGGRGPHRRRSAAARRGAGRPGADDDDVGAALAHVNETQTLLTSV